MHGSFLLTGKKIIMNLNMSAFWELTAFNMDTSIFSYKVGFNLRRCFFVLGNRSPVASFSMFPSLRALLPAKVLNQLKVGGWAKHTMYIGYSLCGIKSRDTTKLKKEKVSVSFTPATRSAKTPLLIVPFSMLTVSSSTDGTNSYSKRIRWAKDWIMSIQKPLQVFPPTTR